LKVVWLPSARADLQRHIDYTRQYSPRGARRIRERVLKRIADLRQFPDSGTITAPDIRELVVTQTPYVVVFRRTPVVVTIIAIFHGAQNR